MQNSVYTPIPGSMLASTPSTELISCLTKTNKAISHANAAREARAPRDARKVVKMTKNAEDANELNKASRVKAAANSGWQHRAIERNGYFFHHQGGRWRKSRDHARVGIMAHQNFQDGNDAPRR